MIREEAVYHVKDVCERYKSLHGTYPSEIEVGGEVWRGLVAPNYIFPPNQQPTVVVPLFSVGLHMTPDASIPHVKVHPK